mgnify:CR=1 FL=1
MSEAEEIKRSLTQRRAKPRTAGSPKDYVSSGSTLLNMAITGSPNRGFSKGHYYYYVGDSASGKTWFALTCLAEASINPNFDDYKLIHDCPEDGALMDVEFYYGKRMAERLEAPRKEKDGTPVHSTTVEEFYRGLMKRLQAGEKVIYVLDSMDSVTSEADLKHVEKQIKAQDKKAKGGDGEASGSYGTGKAKANSEYLRIITPLLAKTGSILIIISQTRDNISQFSFEKKTRAGGKALKFYATVEIWTSVVEKLKKTVNDKPRVIGAVTELQIKKNRVTGKDRKVQVPFYNSVGIDDVGSCVDYLVDEGKWKKGSTGIAAADFDFTGNREKLIKHIEDNDHEKELRQLVKTVWDEIEEKSAVRRKSRYE